MLNNTQKLLVLALSGAALATASNGSHASNVYRGAALTAGEEAAIATFQPPYWFCPAEFRVCPMPTITAKADDSTSRTDATAVDMPEPSGWSLENERRYYDYSQFILGD